MMQWVSDLWGQIKYFEYYFTNYGKIYSFNFIDKLNIKPFEWSSFNKYFMLQEDEKERCYFSSLKKYIFFMWGFEVFKIDLY